jgi:hypothetical protein
MEWPVRRQRRNVIAAYEAMLGRAPESDAVVQRYSRIGIERTLRSIANSPEFKALRPTSPFFHYNAMFDAHATIARHARNDLAPHPDYLTNFIGVRIDPKFVPAILHGRAGEVEGIPIPANWHADIAEWAAALRAVDLARETFTMAELGCGWGCWMNNTGVAARAAGLNVQLIGVEGEEGHIGFAREACAANGFAQGQVTLKHGIAAPSTGTALFPRHDKAGEQWGLEPIFGATAQERAAAVRSGEFYELPTISLGDLISGGDKLDLLHVDIQGGEADLIDSSRPVLDDQVAYIVVGTHSRQIEGRIFKQLLGATWRLEIERPAIINLGPGGPTTTVDGVQGWRNLALASD